MNSLIDVTYAAGSAASSRSSSTRQQDDGADFATEVEARQSSTKPTNEPRQSSTKPASEDNASDRRVEEKGDQTDRDSSPDRPADASQASVAAQENAAASSGIQAVPALLAAVAGKAPEAANSDAGPKAAEPSIQLLGLNRAAPNPALTQFAKAAAASDIQAKLQAGSVASAISDPLATAANGLQTAAPIAKTTVGGAIIKPGSAARTIGDKLSSTATSPSDAKLLKSADTKHGEGEDPLQKALSVQGKADASEQGAGDDGDRGKLGTGSKVSDTYGSFTTLGVETHLAIPSERQLVPSLSREIVASAQGLSAAERTLQASPLSNGPAPSALKVLNIQISPPDLGNVTVRMSLSDDALNLHLSVEQPRTRALIEGDRHAIEQSLSNIGYTVGSMTIDQASKSSNDAAYNGNDPSPSNPQQNNQSSSDTRGGSESGRSFGQQGGRGEGARDYAYPAERGSAPDARGQGLFI